MYNNCCIALLLLYDTETAELWFISTFFLNMKIREDDFFFFSLPQLIKCHSRSEGKVITV